MNGWLYTVRPLGRLKIALWLMACGWPALMPALPIGFRFAFATVALAGVWIGITGLWWGLRLIGTLFRRPPR